MTRDRRLSFQVYSAIFMLVAGVALSVAGFCVPPVGEISDSVLFFFAQCLIYAGSIFGVTVYIQGKYSEILKNLNQTPPTTDAATQKALADELPEEEKPQTQP